MEILGMLFGFFVAIIPHEVAHAWVAYRLGDPTAKQAHRLTLNPLAHVDLIGTVLLPLFLMLMNSRVLFGWAKPVPFNPAYFKDQKTGIALVGLAGPATNILLAVLFAMGIRFGHEYTGNTGLTILIYACLTNLFLGLFNLVPIPPLDGSRILVGALPDSVIRPYMRLEPFGFIIIFAMLNFGLLNFISVVAVEAFGKLVGSNALNLPP